MRFTPDSWPGIAAGTINRTFRLWRRPMVKVGGHYRTGQVTVEVDRLERVALGSVSNADARRSGFADRPAMVKFFASRSDAELDDATTVWRVDFHRVEDGDDQPGAAARLAQVSDLDDDELAEVVRRLDGLDRRAAGGAWTRAVLKVISEQPEVVSTELAAALGRERFAFKEDVRKLKRLGLTESLERGYRLSPRGLVVLQRLTAASAGDGARS
jgi:hypothetical protein